MSTLELRRTELPASPVNSGNLDELGRVVKAISDTDFVPVKWRDRPGAILAAILYGRSVGLDGMVALQEVYAVEGRPALSATAALGLIRRAGHSVTFEENESECVAYGIRADNRNTHTAVFSMEDAKRANLLGKQNWQQYPRAMLRSRATTELACAPFPDVFAGLAVYAPEELGGTLEAAGDYTRPPDDQAGGREPAASPKPDEVDAREEYGPPLPEAETVDPLGAARRRHFALLGELDENPALNPPDGSESWGDFSAKLARNAFGVASRADLTEAEQWHELTHRVNEAIYVEEAPPFG